jgi:galactonate dehydratase
MKITDVTVQLVQSQEGRKWTHVYVHTDEGITGIGEATYSFKEFVVAKMVEEIKEFVIGKDPFNAEAIYADLYANGRIGYRTGGIMFTSAISGIDQALWDIKGKAVGAPVCTLLGGPRTAKVPIYSHFGGKTIEERIASAQKTLAQGFKAIKSATCHMEAKGPKVTHQELKRIEASYIAYRKALGEDVELMDDTYGYFDPPTILKIARMLEPYRLLFLEEPCIPENPEGYARVREGTSTPLAGSERLTSKYRFNDFFRLGAVDIAQPDIVYIGGITEMKKVAALAEVYQVTIAPHNTKGPVGIMASAHVMAAIPNPLIQEFVAPSVVPWRNDVLKHPLVIEDGCLVVPDRPGLGVEFDEEALKPHLVK